MDTQIKIGKDKDVVVEASDEILHVKYYIVDGFNVEKVMYLGKEITTIRAIGMATASLKASVKEGDIIIVHDRYGISHCGVVEEGATMRFYDDHMLVEVNNVKELRCPNKGEIDFAVQELNKHDIEAPISYFGAWEYEMVPIPLATLLANGIEIGFE